MIARWLLSIIILPCTVLVLIPLLILDWSIHFAPLSTAFFYLGFVLALVGAYFCAWSMMQFFHFGDGTPAPWDPPKNFVVSGPYKYVRNPMILGVVLLLTAEAIFTSSQGVAIWAAVFFLGNSIYFPFVEEPGLVKRFGEDYKNYCKNVNRWVPRLRAWNNEL